jgi:hypothetical protein
MEVIFLWKKIQNVISKSTASPTEVGKEHYYMDLRTLFLAGLMCLPVSYTKAAPSTLEGHYYLHGVMEMAAELLLRKDGTFAAGAEYGSASGATEGTWHVEDNVLTLESKDDLKPLEKLSFSLVRLDTRQQLEEHASGQEGNFLWRNNYVIEMKYPHYIKPPTQKPKYVYFEFNQESFGSLRLSENDEAWIPYDPQKTLKKIGLSTSANSPPSQWFDVSAAGRVFTINWKKPEGQPIVFTQPYEYGFIKAQTFLNTDEKNLIKNNYKVEVYHNHPKPPPEIKPVDVYWQFKDGAIQQKVWADTNQQYVTLPYTDARELQKIGVRMKGATENIKWFEVNPDTRSIQFEWDAYADPSDLSLLFRDLELTIESNCLAVDFGTGRACFRRQ